MNKQTMIKNYRRFTAAEGYIIGFHLGDDVYMASLDRIPPRYITIQRECAKMHHQNGLYINVTAKKWKQQLIRKGAVRVCAVADLLDSKYNKGVMFERFVSEYYGIPFRGKDNVKFHIAGDLEIDGKQIQVKYEHARICYENTLKKLQKSA